jgi:hypothetical protein
LAEEATLVVAAGVIVAATGVIVADAEVVVAADLLNSWRGERRGPAGLLLL